VWLIVFESLTDDATSRNDVVLEITADHGTISLDEGFELEAASMLPIDVRLFKRAMTIAGPLDSTNRTLGHLSYRCGYNCPLLDAVTLTIRHTIEHFEHRHQRKIWVELREPLVVPKVVLDQNVAHMSVEDSAFQFAQIFLRGTPSQEASLLSNPNAWIPDANPEWLSTAMPAAETYTLDITVSTGAVFCTFEIAQCSDDRRSQSSVQSLVGSFAALSMALQALAYQPPVNWNSEQHLDALVVEWTFRVSDGARVNETYADLVVSPRVDPPVIVVPSVLEDAWLFTTDHLSPLRLQCLPVTISEDEAFQFDGLSVRATDLFARDELALFHVAMSVQRGTLSADRAARCVSRYSGSDRSNRFSFTAGLACTNQVLEALTYTSNPHFSGGDTLELRVETVSTSEMEAADTVAIPLTVVEVNDAPYIVTTSREFYSCDEDLACVITDLKLIDPDSAASGDRLKVTISVEIGSVALLYDTDAAVSVKFFESEGMVLTIEASLAHLSRVLSSVVYTSAKDWNSLETSNEDEFDGREHFDTITITATDFSAFNASTTSVFRVFIAPTADPVVIHPPGNLRVSAVDGEDGTEAIRGDEDAELSIRGLAFSSVDETSRSSLFVRLSVAHGRLLLPVTDGVSIDGSVGGNDAERELSLRGTFAHVNRSVAFVRYTPDANFVGSDAFEVQVFAVDEYTGELTPTTTISVDILLEPVNDAPSWDVLTPSVSAQLDEPTLISGISLRDIDLEGVDCHTISCVMDVTIDASNGFVSLPRLSQPAIFSTADGVAADGSPLKQSSFLVISGTVPELNAALSEIVFELDRSEFYRADIPSRSHVAVSLRADDRGNFGKGGPQTSTTTVFVRPIEWTVHGLLLAVPHTVLSLDEDQNYTFGGQVWLHDPDAARSHRALLEVDVRCNHGDFVFRTGIRGVQVLSSESHHVVVRGFLPSLNEALNGSSYVPDSDWFGSDEVIISVRDITSNIGRTTQATMFVFIAPVCDPPTWSVRWMDQDYLEAVEDEFLAVDMVSLATPDLDSGDERSVRVKVSAVNGGLMLATTNGLLITDREYYTASMSPVAADRLRATMEATDGSLHDSRLFFSRVQVAGSVGDINQALAGLVYKPHRDYNSGSGTSWGEIVLVAWTDCDGQLSMGSEGNITLPVAVQAVRDPVVLLSKSFQRLEQEDSPEQLLSTLGDAVLAEVFEDTATLLEQLKLMDVDDPDELGFRRFQVTVSCWCCSVVRPTLAFTNRDKVSQLMYLTPPKTVMDGKTTSWSSQLVAVGNAKSLNDDLLSSLRFVGSPNFSGMAIVLVRVDDLNVPTSVGSRSSVAYAFPVRVLELQDDAPEIYLPDIPALQVDENSSVLLRGVQEEALQPDAEPRWRHQTSLIRVCSGCSDSGSRQQVIHTAMSSGGAGISYLTRLSSGRLLFSARHPTLGQELWKSDGTEAGTALLKDILPGNESSSPSFLTRFSVDGRVYFSASGPDLSWMLDPDRHDRCQGFFQSYSHPSAFYAVAQSNVWDPDEVRQ
jgi:ELWxxDGT repeat protein